MTTNQMTTIHHQFTLEAPIEQVWGVIASSEGLAAWLMENDFTPELGAKFNFRMPPQGDWNGIVHCEVLALEQPHRLSISWTSDMLPSITVVTFELEATAQGSTTFTLTHEGWDQLPAEFLPLRNMLDQGWGSHMQQRIADVLRGLNPDDCHQG